MSYSMLLWTLGSDYGKYRPWSPLRASSIGPLGSSRRLLSLFPEPNICWRMVFDNAVVRSCLDLFSYIPPSVLGTGHFRYPSSLSRLPMTVENIPSVAKGHDRKKLVDCVQSAFGDLQMGIPFGVLGSVAQNALTFSSTRNTLRYLYNGHNYGSEGQCKPIVSPVKFWIRGC